MANKNILSYNSISEFIGTGLGDSIGIVIANINDELLAEMKLPTSAKAIGIVSARTGATTHMLAADEAAKSSNVDIARIELCRDTKGGAGHGSSVIFAGQDVSDVRNAVEFMLTDLNRTFQSVYVSEYGHLEAHFTPSANVGVQALFPTVPKGSAFGVLVGAPAAVGLLMSDTAVKSGDVKIAAYLSASMGTSLTNEIVLGFYGETSAVKTAVDSARSVGLALLQSFGTEAIQFTKL